MHELRLAPEHLAGIRRTVDAPADGERAAWGDEQVHAFSLRVEVAVERALRASHPQATDAELSFATAAHWAAILDAVCQLWTPHARVARGRPETGLDQARQRGGRRCCGVLGVAAREERDHQ